LVCPDAARGRRPALAVAPSELPPLGWKGVAGALAEATLGRRFVYLETTTSTNDIARSMAVDGAPQGTVVVADAQSAGRGRAGKSPWRTLPRTCLAVSVLLRPPPAISPATLARVGMAAGVAVVAAVQAVARVSVALKWPNDVVAGSGKLGGILVESALRGDAVTFAICGIGLNVNLPGAALGSFPDAALAPTSLLDLTGTPVSREALLLYLLRELDRLYAGLCSGEAPGVQEVHRRYSAALALRRRPVQVTGNGDRAEGMVERVTPEGALVVRLANGERRTFAYGEVTLRPSDPAQPTAGQHP
jgi:BirA family transcriptional regulator, biotin operon repressor / biotin---[acetyl-CoA-carboxylase] ligase